MTRKRDWLPMMWSDWGETTDSPFYALRKQIDTLLEDFDRGDMVKGDVRSDFRVRTNVSETDTEVRITAELPGIERDDVDVEITGDTLTIQGEKAAETSETGGEEGREFRRLERHSGSFRRTTRLPFEIDPETVTAEISNGVLTVTVPKPTDMTQPAHRIEVKTAA